MSEELTPSDAPLNAVLADEFAWLAERIDAEMAEYRDGAYAKHGSARDQLQRIAADVMAPLQARIRELTLYAAQVESERDDARADALRAYNKLNGLHVSARAHRDRVRELESGRVPLSDETIERLMPEPTVCRANVVRWDSKALHTFARAIEREHHITGEAQP